jgi:anti-anti-sigma factor
MPSSPLQDVPGSGADRPIEQPPQRAARIVGVLFILTFVTSIAALLLYDPVLNDADFIVSGTADTQITVGALLEIGLVITNIGTALVLFPILRRWSETLALGFVASRIVECVFIAMGAIALLSILTLQDESGAGAAALLVQAETLVAFHDWTFLFGPSFCVAVGNGMILGYLFYKSQLVPRRMAMFGLVGGPLIGLSSVLILFGVYEQTSSTAFFFAFPEMIWEASLGIYLTVKGFRRIAPPAAVTEPGGSNGAGPVGDLDVQVRTTGARVELVLEGELTLATAARFRETVKAHEATGPAELVLDVRALRFIDSAGLSELVSAHRRGRAEERRVVVVKAAGPIDKVLAMSGLDKALETTTSPT